MYEKINILIKKKENISREKTFWDIGMLRYWSKNIFYPYKSCFYQKPE